MIHWRLFNDLAFAWRQWHLRRPSHLTPAALCAGLPTPSLPLDTAALDALQRRWPGVAEWPRQYPPMVVRESLNALDVYATWVHPIPVARHGHCAWLDVGSKNGAALPGLAMALRDLISARTGELTGVELDAGRRYRHGQRRLDHGVTLAQCVSDDSLTCRYVAADVRSLDARQDMVTWFLPFVFESPHLNWGLPRARFHPQAVFDHVMRLLKPGGLLLIVNLNPEEAEAQAALIASCPTPCAVLRHGPVTDRFLAYGGQRQGWLLQRH